jgi:hypothetical protein
MIHTSAMLPRLLSCLTLDAKLHSRHHMSRMLKNNANRQINSYLFDEVSYANLNKLWDDRYLCIIPSSIQLIPTSIESEIFYYVKTQKVTGICFYNRPNHSQKIFLADSLRFHINFKTSLWHYYPLLDFRNKDITDRFNLLIHNKIKNRGGCGDRCGDGYGDMLQYEIDIIKQIKSG